MTTRASCYNCGLVATYHLPYRALIVQAKSEPEPGQSSESAYSVEDGRSVPFLCTNCGLPRLETVYWGDSSDKERLFIDDEIVHVGG